MTLWKNLEKADRFLVYEFKFIGPTISLPREIYMLVFLPTLVDKMTSFFLPLSEAWPDLLEQPQLAVFWKHCPRCMAKCVHVLENSCNPVKLWLPLHMGIRTSSWPELALWEGWWESGNDGKEHTVLPDVLLLYFRDVLLAFNYIIPVSGY